MPVTRLRSQLRMRAAVRAGAALTGAAAGLVVLAAAGTGLGGSAAGAVLVLIVALLVGLGWHRGERDGLRARLAAAVELPQGSRRREQQVDRAIFGVYAAAMLVISLVLGFAFASAVWAALAVLAVTLGFTFADLLGAREVEVYEQDRSVIVYTSRLAGVPKRAGAEGPPLYVERRTRRR